MVAIVAPSK